MREIEDFLSMFRAGYSNQVGKVVMQLFIRLLFDFDLSHILFIIYLILHISFIRCSLVIQIRSANWLCNFYFILLNSNFI